MDTHGSGTRRGSRRAARPRPRLRLDVTLTLIATLALAAGWVFLVMAAIDFGSAARSGRTAAWAYLGVACLGAIACLFAALMLGLRMLRQLGVVNDRDRTPPETPQSGHRH